MPKTLIVAAGGRVSRRVAAALCDRGEPPRALVRDAAKARDVLVDNRGAPLPLEIVVSDFANRDGVRRALVGIEIAFLALGSSLQQVELEQRFIDVAAEVGLPHLVKLSAAEARSDGVASVLRWHAAIESHLAASGVPHTLLSPSTFADVLMLAAPSIRATDRWSGSAPHGRNALIDSADVVDAAIAVLSEPSKRGRRHVLTGPVALTWPEARRSSDASTRATDPVRCGIDRGAARAARGRRSRSMARRALARTGRDQPIQSLRDADGYRATANRPPAAYGRRVHRAQPRGVFVIPSDLNSRDSIRARSAT